jgi:ATP-binding cassette subfamily B protein
MTPRHAVANPHPVNVTGKAVPRGGWSTVFSLLPYLWPKNEPALRVRLVLAVVAMLLAVVATVYVPIP